ncbi:uncharacterized protein LOC106179950 [Lingula anatina]|uniref:Uncharacterized protein LOC106179950 n=1 Tax=Lingula anatina TaxID=7574 RepID=A0A1S3K9Q8_LINAN|nr:uncharacterized protein LOC106179950 [Lingula anatina]|eukprot:XP_013419232.1 uncharacterized protein LOC106179950 [Lingula anatina]
MARYLIFLCMLVVSASLGLQIEDDVSLLKLFLRELMDSEKIISKKSGCNDEIIVKYAGCYRQVPKMKSTDCVSRVDHYIQFMHCIYMAKGSVSESCKAEMGQKEVAAMNVFNRNLQSHGCLRR